MMSFVTQSEIEGSKEILELAGWPPGGGITFQPTTGSILLHGMYPVEMHLPISIQHPREVRCLENNIDTALRNGSPRYLIVLTPDPKTHSCHLETPMINRSYTWDISRKVRNAAALLRAEKSEQTAAWFEELRLVAVFGLLSLR
jgi:hypothetical protein